MINIGVDNIYSCKKKVIKNIYCGKHLKDTSYMLMLKARLVLCINKYICVIIPFLFGFQAHVSDSISLADDH